MGCIERNLWIIATHIPGKLNVLADKEWRYTFYDNEWKLDLAVLKRVQALWGKPSMDLFASRLGFQLRPFVSWKPDPQAFAIDAFPISWTEHNFYWFSPFCVNQQGFTEDRTGSITRCNHRPSLYHSDLVPRLLRMLVGHPVLLTCYHQLLTLPINLHWQPLHNKLKLMA